MTFFPSVYVSETAKASHWLALLKLFAN